MVGNGSTKVAASCMYQDHLKDVEISPAVSILNGMVSLYAVYPLRLFHTEVSSSSQLPL